MSSAAKKVRAPRENTPAALRAETVSRLLAQAYVRENFSLRRAWLVVFPNGGTASLDRIPSRPAFAAELERLMQASGIVKEEALTLLWTVLQSSVLDFLGDDGKMLPVPELKKLPRIMQAMIGEIKVTSNESATRGKRHQVQIKLLDKLVALRQLAEIMKWIGPAQVINHTTIHISDHMRDADTRARRLEAIYEQAPREIIAGTSPTPVDFAGDAVRDAGGEHADQSMSAHPIQTAERTNGLPVQLPHGTTFALP